MFFQSDLFFVLLFLNFLLDPSCPLSSLYIVSDSISMSSEYFNIRPFLSMCCYRILCPPPLLHTYFHGSNFSHRYSQVFKPRQYGSWSKYVGFFYSTVHHLPFSVPTFNHDPLTWELRDIVPGTPESFTC